VANIGAELHLQEQRLLSIDGVFRCQEVSRRLLSGIRDHNRWGNARAGRDAIRKYGCYACHTIAGVPGARGLVGPPHDGISSRQFIAGELPNTPAHLTRWVQHPRQVEPHTLMPEIGVTEDDSRDIAAYLYTLRAPHSPVSNPSETRMSGKPWATVGWRRA
jgi:cytochrome c